MMKTIGICFLVILLLLSVSYAGVSYYMMLVVTEPKVETYDKIEHDLKVKYEVNIESLPLEKTMVESVDGIQLETLLYRNPKRSGKVVVLSHGIRQNGELMLQFFNMYDQLGFDIITFSYRNHGKSTKSVTTFGKTETADLHAIMSYAHQQFGEDSTYSIHGVSMGAAIMLQYGHQYKAEKQYDYLVSDCGFADLGQILTTRFQDEYHPISFLPLVQSASFISKHIGRGDFFDIAPQNDVRHIEAPILFIHGKHDRYIPIEHAYALYQARPEKSRLVEMEYGGHAESYLYNKQHYEEVIRQFYVSE